MKRIRQCLIAAAAFALIFGTAYADSTINAVVDDAASAIKVSGEFDNSAKDYVNIQILSGRYDAASFDELSEEEIYGKVKYFRQKSFADGNYEFDISFNGESGWYTVVVSELGAKPSFEQIFFYRQEDTENVISTYNSLVRYDGNDANEINTRAEGIMNLIDKYESSFFSSLKFYPGLSDSDKRAAAAGVIGTGEQTLISDIIKTIDTQSRLRTLYVLLNSSTERNSEAADVITQSSEYLKLSGYAETETYLNQTSDFKIRTVQRMRGVTVDDIPQRFRNEVFLTSIEMVPNSGNVSSVLESAEKSLGIDISEYKAFDRKSLVNEAVAGKSYATVDELLSAIRAVIKGSDDVKNSSPGGGGGGGSKTSGGVKTSIDIAQGTTGGQKALFNDFDSTHWAYNAVYYLKGNGIIDGYGDGSFKPDNNITRAEFLKLVMTALKLGGSAQNRYFADVEDGKWYSDIVNTAAEYGIVTGDSNGRFNPEQYILREEAAVIVHRAANFAGFAFEQPANSENFADESRISDYAKEPVKALKNSKIINGSNGMFDPKSNATRAEMSQMLYSLLIKK